NPTLTALNRLIALIGWSSAPVRRSSRTSCSSEDNWGGVTTRTGPRRSSRAFNSEFVDIEQRLHPLRQRANLRSDLVRSRSLDVHSDQHRTTETEFADVTVNFNLDKPIAEPDRCSVAFQLQFQHG